MAHKVESSWAGSFVRIKTSVTDDANPQTVQDLATAKVDNLTAVAAGSSVSVFDAGSAIWSANELIGAALFLTAGLNGGNRARKIFSIIEANTTRLAQGLVKPGKDGTAWAESFYDADYPAQGFIRPCGMQCSRRQIHMSVAFTGGTAPTCSVVLWCWNREAQKWLKLGAECLVKVAGDNTVIDDLVYFTAEVPPHAEIYPQITTISGTANPTAVTLRMEEV